MTTGVAEARRRVPRGARDPRARDMDSGAKEPRGSRTDARWLSVSGFGASSV